MAQNVSHPSEFWSPDKLFSVKIAETPTDAESSDGEAQMLVVAKNGHPIIKIPTDGYILNAFWSPNRKYVAVNVRNAHSGDYTWVFSLPDKSAIKKPFDDLGIKDDKARPAHSEFDTYEVHRQWILATGWDDTGRLHIKIETTYKNIRDYLSDELIYEVTNDKLLLVKRNATKKFRPN